jgi:hypothetical protein
MPPLPNQSSKQRSKRTGFIWIGLLLGLILIAIYGGNREHELEPVAVQVPWDSRLLACNNVQDASPTEDFTTCLEVAADGWLDAMHRLVWAYSREGEFYDIERMQFWLDELSSYDEYSEVFSQILMFNKGQTPELKLKGEKGIRQLASINKPIASAYLAAMYYLELNILPKRERIDWLLERSYKKDKNWLLPTDFALIYAEGFLGEKQPEKAQNVLREAVKYNFPFHANNIAWLMATSTIAGLADYPTSLDIALKVTNAEGYTDRYVYVDTLAAAYAANGDYANAVKTQQSAIDLLVAEKGKSGSEPGLIESFEQRLSLFEQGKNYTEEIATNGKAFFTGFKAMIESDLLNSYYFEIESKEPLQENSATAN